MAFDRQFARYERPIKKAERIEEIPNAFPATPLSGDDLDIFYNETMEVRTADPSKSPIEDLFDACTNVMSLNHIFLLMGHRGCGKSTELNKMAERMRQEGFLVRTIYCQRDIGSNPAYTDLLILMGEALIDMAREIGCDFSSELGRAIQNFWNTEITTLNTTEGVYKVSFDTEAGIQTPDIFQKILSILAKIKAGIKFKQTDILEYRGKIERRSEEWYDSIAEISDIITEQMNGYQPIIIFEDLDKLDTNPEAIWKMFRDHADNMCSFTFPVIYTFPIALSYDPEFGQLQGYTDKILPMIEIEYLDGTECTEGINCIRRIVSSRAEDALFEEEALIDAIKKTGGSLRDLFRILREASTRTRRRRATRVEREDFDRALITLQSDLRRRLETGDYEFLRRIMDGEKVDIEDRQKLLTMIKADAVLEYNSRRWNNVHPLVADFLAERGDLR